MEGVEFVGDDGGFLVPLSPQTRRVFTVLVDDPFRVFSRQEILERAWDMTPGWADHYHDLGGRMVDVHIGALRRMFAQVGLHDLVVTVRGRGWAYRRR